LRVPRATRHRILEVVKLARLLRIFDFLNHHDHYIKHCSPNYPKTINLTKIMLQKIILQDQYLVSNYQVRYSRLQMRRPVYHVTPCTATKLEIQKTQTWIRLNHGTGSKSSQKYASKEILIGQGMFTAINKAFLMQTNKRFQHRTCNLGTWEQEYQ